MICKSSRSSDGKLAPNWYQPGFSGLTVISLSNSTNQHTKWSFLTASVTCTEPEMKNVWGFPGGPVVKTPQFQCRGHGCDPQSGN